ncbi:PLP-dependent aminotransferase family protein [Yokenella regensburgei]|uniref:MocR-like pyridoxine biosynthesis transcription factor PdxR n=1 Tax=Yokenella regensburgei TaxID=158877 RepID=UPI003F13C9D0
MKTGYREIYARFREDILQGLRKPGDKVPSVRLLATELKVARKTVETAYAILAGEGYLVTQGARGTRINPELKLPAVKKIAPQPPLQDTPLASVVNLRDQQGFMRLGIPALDAFPTKKWLLLSAKTLRALPATEMVNPPLMGYPPLREAIARYLNISRGLNCSANQIFITSGYRNNLSLILTTLAEEQDKVVLEDPGYFFGQQLLKRTVKNLHTVPVDAQGLDVNYLLAHHPDTRFVFTTPSHHSPLAVTLSLPRKHQLLEWARANNAWIIEDDYDGEFHYTRKVLPALKSLDTHDRVIYMGTFSKTILPSLRISYLVMPRSTINAFHETGEITENGQPILTQKIVASFLSEGHFFRHLKKMRALYQQRREMMIAALRHVFSDCLEVENRDGGMHIVAYLKQPISDVGLAKIWHQHQLRVSPLSEWYSDVTERYGLIMGYTNLVSEGEAIALFKRVEPETRAYLGI